MNREALPLVALVLIPIVFVGLIVSYVQGFDYLSILRRIDLIYYIVLVPFVLGVLAAAVWLRKNPD
jgi:hypothetical protein